MKSESRKLEVANYEKWETIVDFTDNNKTNGMHIKDVLLILEKSIRD